MEDLQDKIIELMDLFDDEVVTTADKIDRPQRALEKEAIDDFMKRNPMAGGGMLVQPSADGSRPGYSGEYGPNIRESKKSNSFEVTIERGKKVFNKSFNFKTYGSKEKALEAAKEYRNEKSKLTDTRGDKKGGFGAGAPGGSKEQTGGKAKIEKILNNFIKEGKTSFSNADIRAKMKVENFYKSDLNFRRAVDVIKKQPEYKNLTFIKKPRVENPDEAAKLVRKKRQEGLKETDTTKAKGTKKYPFHHIRQITGGVPLTTDDVVIINQRMNSVMSQYDKSLNAIASAIQKNNRLALEAMNAKDEGTALKYMARVDELNETAEKIVNSAIKKLPKKYDGLVGFNQFTLPRNEYGLPISNEPMIIRKVGGMPVSKDAIDLTTLNLKQEKEFRDLVKTQAQAGKTGQIKGLAAFIKRNFPDGEIICNLSTGINCNNPEAYQKSLNELSEKAAQGDQAAKTTLSKFGNKVATAGKLIKGALGPLAIATEVALEGGIALNKTLNEGVPIKQAFADSLTNKYLLGPKLQIDKEAEIAKEMAKGEEFAMAKRGERMFLPQSATADAQRLKKREEEMKALYPQLDMVNLSNKKIDELLSAQGVYSPFTLGFGMQQKQPGIGDMRYNEDVAYDEIRDIFNKGAEEDMRRQQMQSIADAGGIANLAKGGRAGYKLGKLIKVKPSKVREDVKAIIDDSMKMQQKIDTTTELDKLIKKTLDEDLFDKKDRIVDSINISEAKKRRNYPYNMQVFEEPKNLDFYRDIKESDFRTKTGPYYDRIRRLNKAGGGLLKQAGDRSGAPPVSGPNPQGLQGLLNRGKKI